MMTFTTKMCAVAALLWGAFGVTACEAECQGDAAKAIEAFVPEGQEVHCTDRASFALDDRTVSLVLVEYGERRDCPSGCFSSNLCAVEDGDSLSLFYASWNDASEEPLGIRDECPDPNSMETWPDCEPSGRVHPVVSTEEFKAFIDEQAGSGPFRMCANRFAF